MAHKSALQKSKEMLDRINKRKAEQDAKKAGLKLEEGDTELRFFQFNDEGEWMAFGFFHYGFSELFLCPTTYGEDCPACEFVKPFWKGDADDEATAKKLGRKLRYFANASRIACKKPDNEVVKYAPAIKIYTMSEKIAVALLGLTQDEDYGDITDLKTGRNVRIKRTGKTQFNTRYGDPIPRPTANAFPLTEELQKQIVDLNEYVNKSRKTSEEISNIIANVDPEGGDGTVEVEPEAEETAPANDNWDEGTPATEAKETPAKEIEKESPKENKPATTKKLSVAERVKQLRAKNQ